jgi:hypothetical protein
MKGEGGRMKDEIRAVPSSLHPSCFILPPSAFSLLRVGGKINAPAGNAGSTSKVRGEEA